MSSKLQISTHDSGTILGLKWYWWLLIIIIVIFMIGGVSSIFGGNGQSLGSKLAQGVLGFSAGVLNALSKSPLAWFFAIVFLGPFAFRGACAMYKSYKEHYAKGKTNEDACKELDLTKENFDKLSEEVKKAGDEKKALEEQIKELKKTVQDASKEKEIEKLKEVALTSIDAAKTQMDAYNERDAEDATEDGIEPDPIKEGDYIPENASQP